MIAKVKRTRGSVMMAMNFENVVSVGFWICWSAWKVAVFSVMMLLREVFLKVC